MRDDGTGAATVHPPERAFWVTAPGEGALLEEDRRDPGVGEVRIRTRFSGISRGTESLVFRGGVPASERERMRAPFQEGAFPGPVKYGYLSVGEVEAGSPALLGRTVFALAPHQTASTLPTDAVVPVPASVPARRAVLAGMVETALNALWDRPLLVGDRVAVVGAGLLGCTIARLAARHPGVTVTLVDVDASRATVAAALGAAFASPQDAPLEQDVVFHASGTSAGLSRALELLRAEGEVIDASWYGDRPVALALGEAFHARRLGIRSTQVGTVSPAMRGSRTARDRLALALELLADDAFDALVTDEVAFEELPQAMADIAAGRRPGLGCVVDYGRG